MPPLPVVKDPNIFKHSLFCRRTGLISLMVCQFGFERMEEAFRYGIIPAIALTAHTPADTVLP